MPEVCRKEYDRPNSDLLDETISGSVIWALIRNQKITRSGTIHGWIQIMAYMFYMWQAC
jgi:hypothetical protein